MTQSLTCRISEKSTINRDDATLSHDSIRPYHPPKFVDHPELKGRWAYKRFFSEVVELTAQKPAVEREAHCFKQMHFCARRMMTLFERYGDNALWRNDYRRFARLHQQLRDDIAHDNIGLVYSQCKRIRLANMDEDELLSEGMMALARAIEKFNPWLGFRFSTYACNAILRMIYRCRRRNLSRLQHESVSFVESKFIKDNWLDTSRIEESSLYVERLGKILSEGTTNLTRIEECVLTQRFLGTDKRTLAAVGQRMNFSKERIRQIEKAALAKLRTALEGDHVLNPEQPIVLKNRAHVHLADTCLC